MSIPVQNYMGVKNQANGFTSPTSDVIPLEKLMAPSADSSDGPTVEDLLKWAEFSSRILDGTPKTKKDILGLFNEIKKEDGKLYFTSITKKYSALGFVLEQLKAAPEAYDPSVNPAVEQAFINLSVLESEINRVVDQIINPTVENGGKFPEWEKDS